MTLEDRYAFSTYSGEDIGVALVKDMSDLFSSHYGVWDEDASNRKGRVQLSPKRIRENYLKGPSQVVIARERESNQLVGYAIAIRKSFNGKIASWVTQFVVHKEHRKQGIGKNLLYSFWGESRLDAWGIVTSNPYAIRALEKATHRRCALRAIRENKGWLFRFARESISYVDEETEIRVDDSQSVINTRFFVSHSEIPEKIKNISKDAPWILGTLDPGWEWFAFSFKEQVPFPLNDEEIRSFLDTSDEITQIAYSRMDMKNQPWTQYTEYEIGYILQAIAIPDGATVLDLGCGTGRHGLALAEKGYNVTAVDYNCYNEFHQDNFTFIQDDARKIVLDRTFELALCLYDVIGSFAEEQSNEAIINTLVRSVKNGGYVVISVMNIDYLYARNPRVVDLSKDYNMLFTIPSQNTMQKSGNVFQTNGILIDSATNVCYRRESFVGDEQELPREYFVRDKRYTLNQISTLVQSHGLRVIMSKYVKAGDWHTDFTAAEAKEILLICQKRSQDNEDNQHI